MFPQNRYILKHLEKKSRNEEKNEYEICPKHHREKNLFCKNKKCNLEICSICLTDEHRQHNTVDSLTLKSQMVEELIDVIKNFSGEIELRKKIVMDTETETTNGLKKCQEIIKIKMDAFQATIQSKLNELSGFEKALGEILGVINNESVKFKDITAARRSMNKIEEAIANDLNEPLKFSFCDVKERTVTVNSKKNHTNYAFNRKFIPLF